MLTIKQKLIYLNSSGLSDKDIAEKCNCTQSTIWRLRVGNSSKTSWELGSTISELYVLAEKKASAA